MRAYNIGTRCGCRAMIFVRGVRSFHIVYGTNLCFSLSWLETFVAYRYRRGIWLRPTWLSPRQKDYIFSVGCANSLFCNSLRVVWVRWNFRFNVRSAALDIMNVDMIIVNLWNLWFIEFCARFRIMTAHWRIFHSWSECYEWL